MDQNYTLPILDNSLLINFHANTLKVTQNTIMNEEMKYRQMLQSLTNRALHKAQQKRAYQKS